MDAVENMGKMAKPAELPCCQALKSQPTNKDYRRVELMVKRAAELQVFLK